jgi:hypothetical protein
MSTSPIKGKSAAPKQDPNWLDQIAKTWNDVMGGKKAAGASVPKKPSPAPSKASQPEPQNTKAAATANKKPKAATTQRGASTQRAADKPVNHQPARQPNVVKQPPQAEWRSPSARSAHSPKERSAKS